MIFIWRRIAGIEAIRNLGTFKRIWALEGDLTSRESFVLWGKR